jgi:TetR/AcrR family tetracycline transcriptional repressor
MTRETLSREKVLDAALRLAAEQGLAGLSMRRLATEVGVEAMSLYNHVANKGDLLDGMAARVFENIALPDPSLPWEKRLHELGMAAFKSFSEHPVVVRALAAGQANPRSVGALRLIDAILGALLDGGLDERAAARGYRSLLSVLFGSALRESLDLAGNIPDRAEPINDWFRRNVDPGSLPSLHRTLPALMDAHCTPDFADELDLVIVGLRS